MSRFPPDSDYGGMYKNRLNEKPENESFIFILDKRSHKRFLSRVRSEDGVAIDYITGAKIDFNMWTNTGADELREYCEASKVIAREKLFNQFYHYIYNHEIGYPEDFNGVDNDIEREDFKEMVEEIAHAIKVNQGY